MAVYGMERVTQSTIIATAAYELRTASTDRGKVERIHIAIRAATASTFGIGRPGAIGVTPTVPATWLALDPAEPAGTVQSSLSWAIGPTAPVNFFKRIQLAINSEGVILTFPMLLVIGVSSSIVIWNITAVAVVHVSVMGEE